ncbi:unnamed protein product [Pleuronectes platessa]|uniref:Uncharacterized protein n=1 Tax=Pleuronectes platessa TaxID=8262 RepID=A0A9N7YKM0_PLEPL|nr:unnamed protein product [Pleuronectes platessa]
MGEKTASQVQDVVVAGSQSSNFLLPKENKSLSIGVPRLTIVGLCSDSGQPNKAFRGYCPFCWSAGTGAGGRLSEFYFENPALAPRLKLLLAGKILMDRRRCEESDRPIEKDSESDMSGSPGSGLQSRLRRAGFCQMKRTLEEVNATCESIPPPQPLRSSVSSLSHMQGRNRQRARGGRRTHVMSSAHPPKTAVVLKEAYEEPPSLVSGD